MSATIFSPSSRRIELFPVVAPLFPKVHFGELVRLDPETTPRASPGTVSDPCCTDKKLPVSVMRESLVLTPFDASRADASGCDQSHSVSHQKPNHLSRLFSCLVRIRVYASSPLLCFQIATVFPWERLVSPPGPVGFHPDMPPATWALRTTLAAWKLASYCEVCIHHW